ncbi:hypothetical protein, partial [Acetobacter senegalensis]|uniref:hypothetical protein n=1 Tax=Acetobacter senegalensis TaxID=446692 RepID=UPI001EDA54C6
EAGRLGGWEAGRLGGWEAGRLGGWEAGRLFKRSSPKQRKGFLRPERALEEHHDQEQAKEGPGTTNKKPLGRTFTHAGERNVSRSFAPSG